jgi:hypothetical protein
LHARYPALQATRLPLMDQPADSYSLATVIGQSRVTFSCGPGRTACLSGSRWAVLRARLLEPSPHRTL